MSGSPSLKCAIALERNGWIFAVAAGIAPVLSVFAPLGMMPLVGALAALLLADDMIRSRGMPQDLIATWHASANLRRFTLLCALLWAWMLASVAWAVMPRQSLQACLQIAGLILTAHVMLAAALRFEQAQRERILAALLIGLVVAFGLYAVERLGDAPIGHLLHSYTYDGNESVFSPYNRGLTIALLLSFAAAACLSRRETPASARKLQALLVVGAASVAIYFYYGSSLQIALIAALAAALLTLALPKLGFWIIGIAAAIYIGVVPLIPQQVTAKVDLVELSAKTGNVSISHRLAIWSFAAERIFDKPLIGWGMNSARAIPGGKDTVVLSYENGAVSSVGEQLPLHTHNAALQWWLELGALGAILMAGMWLLCFSRMARCGTRGARAAGIGAAIGAFTVANLSYGAWQSWWLATLTLVAALLVLALREDDASRP
ncbi:MAG TPA: O-antigen ligase family protein [Alphaproteobacteria bacterium]|nr:O-antigen ligase family protein [Alphaproteobacteria bacterium]